EDRSLSMERPEREGGGTRAQAAARAVASLRSALRGRAQVEVRGFASRLVSDSAHDKADLLAIDPSKRSSSAPGEALAALTRLPAELRPDGVILVSDGAVNAGADPVAAARALGVPVHTLLVGARAGLARGMA